jgi:hypothetical protein
MNKVFWLESLKGRNHLEDLGIEGKIINLREIAWEGVDWIRLA